jgi:tetratricopeptide (TPR) repeat protein
MKNSILIYITILSFCSFNAIAQKTKVSKTVKKHYNSVDINTIDTYERVAEKGYKSADMFKKVANSFYFNAEMDKAAKWYGELFAITSDVEAEYYYRYAQSLKSIGQNEKANEMMEKFIQKNKENDNLKILLNNNHYEK